MINARNGREITSGQIARYALLPAILPRFIQFFGSGFRVLAFYIAGIFSIFGILPKTHPFLQPTSYLKYGLIRVLAEGARHVTWDKKHIDQVAAYIMVLSAFIILLVQFALLVSIILVPTAFAAPLITQTGSFDFFFTPVNPDQDYALRFLDLVFGLENVTGANSFFESCVGSGAACLDYEGNPVAPYPAWPMPMHLGLHGMLQFYNWAIIGLGFVIILYYFVTILAETSVHGTLWGQRGNKTWIPVRVITFALLIMPLPFYQGFNTAQIVTLNAAYFGTGMASNAWRQLNAVVGDELAGMHQNLIAPPNRDNFPSASGLVQFMTMVKTCAYAEQRLNGNFIDAYIVRDSLGAAENCRPLTGTSYADALDFSGNESIRVRFGQRLTYNPGNAPAGYDAGVPIPCGTTAPAAYSEMPSKFSSESGYVIPYCGEITISATGPELLAELIREGHYNLLVQSLWNDPEIDNFGEQFYETAINNAATFEPDIADIIIETNARDTQIDTNIINAVNALLATPYFDFEASLTECGWMCASLYYNRIAEANGEVQTSVFTMPNISLWPLTSEKVLDQRNMETVSTEPCDMFNPSLPGRMATDFDNPNDVRVASTISNVHEYFCSNDLMTANFTDGGTDSFRSTMGQMGDNPFKDAVSMIFGISGLFDMRENVEIHPLAQLSLLGKGMVESTLRAFGGALAGSMAGLMPLEGLMGELSQIASGPVSSALTTIALVSVTIGFILFYVIPLLPFVYFMFAVAGWVKGIFEAMVGVPLWALAHLRLDGEGLIGPAAGSGYWLIFEILIRPILILTGFLASISIFMAMVKVLNDSFDLVVSNVGGFNARDAVVLEETGTPPGTNPAPFTIDSYRNPIDQFFYTVIYAIIVYMIAIATFKLVDLIPQGILRWAGESVQTFGDFRGDDAAGLMDRIGQGITLTTVLGGGLLGKVGGRNDGSSVVGSSNEDPT